MKKSNVLCIVIIIIALFVGIWHRFSPENKKYEKTEFLFNTPCNITAYGENAQQAVYETFKKLKYINDITNMYNENSEISKINASGSGYEIPTDSAIIEMLKTSLEISTRSDGAFDLTIAPVSRLWEFGKENPAIPDSVQLAKAQKLVNFQNIVINEASQSITKLNDDTMLDFGGVAKGYAADVAAKTLKSYSVSGAIIDLGGNIVCLGKNPNTNDGKWRIGIQVPFAPTGEYGEILEITDGAVVTSGTYQRGFDYNQKRYHHIIDPKTGYPSDKEYNSVTIKAKSALLADCLSTACFVLGKESGANLAESYNTEIFFH